MCSCACSRHTSENLLPHFLCVGSDNGWGVGLSDGGGGEGLGDRGRREGDSDFRHVAFSLSLYYHTHLVGVQPRVPHVNRVHVKFMYMQVSVCTCTMYMSWKERPQLYIVPCRCTCTCHACKTKLQTQTVLYRKILREFPFPFIPC